MQTEEHLVVDIRATGVTPQHVADQMQEALDTNAREGWSLFTVQPVIYNSSTTGYFLLVFRRSVGGEG